MRIDILYFEGCPNHPPAVAMAKDIVRDLGLDAEVSEVEVKGPEDANTLRFLGSPSIQVDGVDIEPEARDRTDYGYACRPYGGAGLPAKAMLEAALLGKSYTPDKGGIRGFSFSRSNGAGVFAAGGSLAAAIVAAACCWLPLVLVAFGASAGSLGAMFEKTRPIFLALAAVLLSVGFYYTYIRKEQCAPGSACEAPNIRRKRFNSVMLWIATVGVVAFAFFPSYVGALVPDSADMIAPEQAMDMAKIELVIGGMTCEGCAINVQQKLASVPGVLNAVVQFDEERAVVLTSGDSPPSTGTLLAALKSAGYEGAAIAPQ